MGPKTAARLLGEFGTLEGILANVESIAKPSVRRSIAENIDRLRLNDRLIRLEGAKALPFSLEELRWTDTGETTVQILRAVGVY